MLRSATRDSACVIVVRLRHLSTALAMLLINKLAPATRGFEIIWKGIYHTDSSIEDLFFVNISYLDIVKE